MKTHKLKVVVIEDGKIVLQDVPVVKGDEVEVAIEVIDPVHGAPLRYDDPFEPAVDPSEWDALK